MPVGNVYPPPAFTTPSVWASGAYYATSKQVVNSNGDLYICSVAHTSAAATEPGIGAQSATVWTACTYGMTADQNAALNAATALDATHPPLVLGATSVLKPAANSTTAIQIQQADGTAFVNFDSLNKTVGIGVVPSYTFHVRSESDTTVTIGNPGAGKISYLRMGQMSNTNNGSVLFNTQTAGMVLTNYYPADTTYGNILINQNLSSTNTTIMALVAGNVGVRTVSPASGFHVASSLTTSPRGIMSSQHNNGTDGARFHGRKSRGTNASPTVIVTGDNLLKLVGSGYDGSAYQEMASIAFQSTGTIGAGRVPTKIVFSTATDASPSVLTDRMTIGADGAVAIVGAWACNNATPQTPAAKTADATGTDAAIINAMRTVLINCGLMSAS